MPPSISKIIRSRRRTIALIVQTDGSLLVRAPDRATLKQINAMVVQHAGWITKKQERVSEFAITPRQFLEGERFPFLGKSYSLKLVVAEKPTLELDRYFRLAKSALGQTEPIFEKWYRQQARSIFTERVEFYAGAFGFEYAKLKLSSARTRWGSCSAQGNINLTWRLVMAPLEIVDYVVVHELSHLREHNHSRAFWSQVEAILPNYKSRRKWLKDNGRNFHWP